MKRTPLVRRTPLRRSGPLRARSTRQREADQQLADVRTDVFVRDRWRCQAAAAVLDVACVGALHAHHIVARSQGGAHTVDNLTTLCGAHHAWCHEHPAEARALGFIRKVGS